MKPRAWDFWAVGPNEGLLLQRIDKEIAYLDLDGRGLRHKLHLRRFSHDTAESVEQAVNTMLERGIVFQPWTTLLMEPESMGLPKGIGNRILVVAFTVEAEMVMFRLLMP